MRTFCRCLLYSGASEAIETAIIYPHLSVETSECLVLLGNKYSERHFLDCNINSVTNHMACGVAYLMTTSVRTLRENHYTGPGVSFTSLSKSFQLSRHWSKILIHLLNRICGEKSTRQPIRPVHRFHISLIPSLPPSPLFHNSEWLKRFTCSNSNSDISKCTSMNCISIGFDCIKRRMEWELFMLYFQKPFVTDLFEFA